MKKIIIIIGIIVSFLIAENSGREIMTKHYNLKKADNMSYKAIMMLIDSKKQKKVRQIEIFMRNTEKGEDTYVNFISPAEVKGTKFLTFGYDNADDEQRIYIPKLGKITRIKSSGKNQSFMGSDLNYYDMEQRTIDDFSSIKYLRKEILKSKECFAIEMVPKNSEAPYAKIISWIGTDNYIIYQIECYDKKTKKKLKTIKYSKMEDKNGILIPAQTAVINHKENHMTLLKMNEIHVNDGVSASLFTIQNLQK